MYGNRNTGSSMYDIKESNGDQNGQIDIESSGSDGHHHRQRHRRQGSSSSFSIDPGSYHVSFSSLENFMQVSRHMQDEIMLPSILRDKHFDLETQNTIKNIALQDNEFINNDEGNSLSLSLTGGASSGEEDTNNNHLDSTSSCSSSLPSSSAIMSQQLLDINSSDVLDHYKFVLLVRSQFTQHMPFLNIDEHPELKYDHFRLVYNKLRYHYREMMNILDSLSSEAKAIMDIYKENI